MAYEASTYLQYVYCTEDGLIVIPVAYVVSITPTPLSLPPPPPPPIPLLTLFPRSLLCALTRGYR